MLPSNTSKNVSYNFVCENCDFKCIKRGDYNRHLLTLKHKNQQASTSLTSQALECDCGKIYKERTGLWRHKKICSYKHADVELDINDKDAIIMQLLQQNSELQKSIITLSKEKNISNSNNNTNNTTTNSNNKTFNLNFFLNETCKNAMNISEFVSSIKVTLEDLEYTGRQGYIQGVSNIILNNLQKLEQHERPLHCNDLKREILYIKENNKWEKETEQKPILTKAIKTIANENIKQIKLWRDKYPNCTDADSKKNNMYLKIVSNSMNGLTEEEGCRNIDKIISNVAKEVVIDK
jgi:hypothetical protein